MDEQEVRQRIGNSGFQEFLGLQVEAVESGRVEFTIPYHDGLDRGAGDLVHGGVLASVLDIAATYAVMSAVDTPVPTVDMRIDYLRPATHAELTVIGEIVRIGGTIAVSQAEVHQQRDGETKQIALARNVLSTAHVDS